MFKKLKSKLFYLWQKTKIKNAIKKGRIKNNGNSFKEIEIVKEKIKELEMIFENGVSQFKNYDIKYIQDTIRILFWKIQWDYQFDSISVIERGGGDCNSLNRLVQVFYHNKGYKAYLVTYIANPFKMSHGTCILNKDDKWYDCDYGYMNECGSFKEALNNIALKYKVKEIIAYEVRDINWDIVKI